MRAMILAAGLGTRMAPLTDRLPKPALPLLGRPLIARMVEQLAELGIERVAVNTHAHPEHMRAALARPPIPVDFCHEPELRGSGGGIHSAIEILRDEPFLVLNADMHVEFDLETLRARHEQRGFLATLLLRDDPRKADFGTIGFASSGEIGRIRDWIDLSAHVPGQHDDSTSRDASDRPRPIPPRGVERWAEFGSGLFTGVHLLSPTIFSCMPERATFQMMTDVYVPALRAGHVLGAVLQDPSQAWWPIGTPAELLDANLRALRIALGADRCEVDPSARVGGSLTPPVWIGPGAHVAEGAELGPDVVVGAGAEVPGGLRGRELLFLEGARPNAAGALRRAVAYGSDVWLDD